MSRLLYTQPPLYPQRFTEGSTAELELKQKPTYIHAESFDAHITRPLNVQDLRDSYHGHPQSGIMHEPMTFGVSGPKLLTPLKDFK